MAQHTAPCFLPLGIPRATRLSRPPGECRHKASSVGMLPVCRAGLLRPGRMRVGLGRGGRKAQEEERPGWSGQIPGTETRRARPPGWAPAAQQPGSKKKTHHVNTTRRTPKRKKEVELFSSPTFIPACSFVGLGSPWIPRQSWSTWPTRPPSGEGEQDPQVGHTHRSEPCSS